MSSCLGFRTPDGPCTPYGFANLVKFEGVYEARSSAVLSGTACDAEPPVVLEPGAPRFVVVSTQVSGTPEVILKSCGEIAECQVLAQTLRTQGDPGPSDPETYRYDHFVDCRGPVGSTDAFILESRLPEGIGGSLDNWGACGVLEEHIGILVAPL